MRGYENGDRFDVPWTVPPAFGDSASLREQGETLRLTALQRDFVRCLAISAWTMRHEIRLRWLGLSNFSALDECLLAGLHRCGWPIASLADEALTSSRGLRVEFVAAGVDSPAHYRAGPSYHDRLGLDLLFHVWERLSFSEADAEAVETVCARLAESTAAFSRRLALPVGLLRRVCAERRAESEAERRMREKLDVHLSRFAADDIRHLAIERALADTDALAQALRRFGTASMRKVLQRHRARSFSVRARDEFEPFRVRLYRELWAPSPSDDR